MAQVMMWLKFCCMIFRMRKVTVTTVSAALSEDISVLLFIGCDAGI